MEGMLIDLSLNREINQQFETYLTEEFSNVVEEEKEEDDKENRSLSSPQRTSFDFHVQVLTCGYWPAYKPLEPLLSSSMQKCVNVFTNFYTKKENGRRLRWLFGLGTVNLRGIYRCEGHRKTYVFQVRKLWKKKWERSH